MRRQAGIYGKAFEVSVQPHIESFIFLNCNPWPGFWEWGEGEATKPLKSVCKICVCTDPSVASSDLPESMTLKWFNPLSSV